MTPRAWRTSIAATWIRDGRLRLGLTQAEFADRLNEVGGHEFRVDEDHLSRWERQKNGPDTRHRAAIRQLLGRPPWEDLPPNSTFTFQDQPVDSEDMQRRELLAKLSMLGLGGIITSGLDLERLAATFAGSDINSRSLDELETVTHDLMRRESDIAPDSLLPAVRGHLEGFRNVLLWTPPGLAPRAYSLAGETALLAGYLAFKLERRAAADVYWPLALRFAEMAGHPKLHSAVLLLQAWRFSNDDLDHALALLDHAESLLGPMPDSAVAALVLSWRAELRATRHSEASGDPSLALRDMDGAHDHLTKLQPSDGALYIFESVSGEVLHSAGWSLLHLDRPAEAAAQLQHLLASIPPSSHSWRSDVHAGLGAAHAQMRDPDQASQLLGTSLSLAVLASAPRCLRRVRATRQQWLAAYTDTPAVRRLDEQLAAIPPPT
jgi:transcriptional regulator with XRE-family HTH domain